MNVKDNDATKGSNLDVRMISALHGDLVADGGELLLEHTDALGRLASEGGFVVVEGVVLAEGGGGEVRHDDICPCEDAPEATLTR